MLNISTWWIHNVESSPLLSRFFLLLYLVLAEEVSVSGVNVGIVAVWLAEAYSSKGMNVTRSHVRTFD
jgi:hypothetical protein